MGRRRGAKGGLALGSSMGTVKQDCVFILLMDSVEELRALSGKKFLSDLHLPELLAFPPQMDFHDNLLYTSGHIILQDKVGELGSRRLQGRENP